MKICWDNIENIRLTKNGYFKDLVSKIYYRYVDKCKTCGEPFLSQTSCKGDFCCFQCRRFTKEVKENLSKMRRGENNGMYGKHHTEESKKKIGKKAKLRFNNIKNHPMYGKTHTKETKKKLSISIKNLNMNNYKSPSWKGGYNSRGIPIYDTYAPQLEWCEEVRRNADDSNVLEVRCFKCNEWFIPTINMVATRIKSINGKMQGYNNFYCSDICKKSCSVYGKTPEMLIKQDAVRAGRIPWYEIDKEVQRELRQMILERDNYTCQKCGSTENLHCHHILPVAIEPLLSADIDNCITLCEKCHKESHQQDGCRYGQLRQCI